jgi:tRNA-modifying protein YgfZ
MAAGGGVGISGRSSYSGVTSKVCQKTGVDNHATRANSMFTASGLTERPCYPIHSSVSTLIETPLPHLGTLHIAGPDAINFLQGQVSNDTRRLQAGEPLLAAYSNSQGRVIAVLHLLPHSSGVLAVLPRDLVQPTCERLRKFVLRAKVKIEDASERLAVSGALDASALAAAGLPVPDERGYLERDGIGIARIGPATAPGPARFWVIRAAFAAGEHREASSETAWRLADIRAGMPIVYAATSEAFVAQMLNLDLLEGISFSKGCYTGQEIIARTQHLGRIKRRMFRLRLADGDWSIGATVALADGRSGRLLELAPAETEMEALAVLNLEPGAPAEDSSRATPAAHATLLPLPYSARLNAP